MCSMSAGSSMLAIILRRQPLTRPVASKNRSAKLQIIERYELDASAAKITRRYEASDLEYFEDVWRGADTVLPSDVPYAPYRCKDTGGAPGARVR